MEIYGSKESIECNSAIVVAKKIQPSPPLHHPIFGKCIKYICQRDGFAKILIELNPKQSRCGNPNSRLNLGDELKANSFYVLVEGFKPLKIEKVPFSGEHRANKFISKSYTYAEICIPYPSGRNMSITFPDDFVNPFDALAKKQ